MDTPIQLTNAPIIEAVLDIECDFPKQLVIRDIEKRASRELAKQYPTLRHVLVQEHQFETKPAEPLKFSVTGGIEGLQFLSRDERQVVQFRRQGFSFNRLAPYSSLDKYLPQMKRTWSLYRDLTKPLQIRLIRLRYINRIVLPLGSGKVELDKYLLNGPRLADPARFELTGFLDQYTAIDKNTGHQINSILTLQPGTDDTLPIIFDNGAMSTLIGDVDDWLWIRARILELREIKNHVFCHTLTEECLNLFQ